MSIKQVALLAVVVILASAGGATAQVAPGSPSFRPAPGVANYPSAYTAPGLSYPSAFLPQSFGNNGMFSATYRSPATPGIVGGASYPFGGAFFGGTPSAASFGRVPTGGSSFGVTLPGVNSVPLHPTNIGMTGSSGAFINPLGTGMNSGFRGTTHHSFHTVPVRR